jgi:hypothetical protein
VAPLPPFPHSIATLPGGAAARRRRRPGLVEKLLTEDRHVGGRRDAEADPAPLDGQHLDGDGQVGQDDHLVKAAREDQHGETPFRSVRFQLGRWVTRL